MVINNGCEAGLFMLPCTLFLKSKTIFSGHQRTIVPHSISTMAYLPMVCAMKAALVSQTSAQSTAQIVADGPNLSISATDVQFLLGGKYVRVNFAEQKVLDADAL